MSEDYYKTLGVSRNSSQAEIQKAYRKMASKFHPDLAEEDKKDRAKERFQQIQKAYDVLNDPKKREMYDRYGSSFESMGGGEPTWQTSGGEGFEFDFSQFFGGRGGQPGGGGQFEDIFQQFARGGGGQRQTRRRATPGADIQHELRIPLKTAVTGGKIELSVRSPNGKVKTISVNIPAGIPDGEKLRLRGQGDPSPNGGKPGDILIQVHVDSHPSFQRRGNDLIVSVPVTLAEAALGAKIDVPSPHGTIGLTVPPCTSSGRRLRVKGFGVKPAKGNDGDLYAEIQIQLPEVLDAESQELIQTLDQETNFDPRTDLKW